MFSLDQWFECYATVLTRPQVVLEIDWLHLNSTNRHNRGPTAITRHRPDARHLLWLCETNLVTKPWFRRNANHVRHDRASRLPSARQNRPSCRWFGFGSDAPFNCRRVGFDEFNVHRSGGSLVHWLYGIIFNVQKMYRISVYRVCNCSSLIRYTEYDDMIRISPDYRWIRTGLAVPVPWLHRPRILKIMSTSTW